MGSYCELYISNFPVSVTKDYINPFLLSVFQPSDLKVFERKIGERIQLLYGREKEAQESEKAIQYISQAKKLKERLNVMGFTMERVEAEFQESKEVSIARLEELKKNPHFKENNEILESMEEEINTLKISSLTDFLKASKEIIQKRYGYYVSKEKVSNSSNPALNYLLKNRHTLDDFPHYYDQRTLLRALLEVTEPDKLVTYDITELVENEFFLNEPEKIYNTVIEEVVENAIYDYEIGDKFLILTEGSSDISILKNSLELLYPHLSEFYSFMDFGKSNTSGSASSLVTTIKSFVAANIKNKIIGLFDNDTAAESAIKGLSKTKIPDNIKIKKYPYLKFLENYPTIGPTGIKKMNINGLAASIELYLGKEILTKNGELIPVKWKGYDSSLNQYQGEVNDKELIQRQFNEKIKTCKSAPNKINDFDWSGIEAIWEMIFNAFNE